MRIGPSGEWAAFRLRKPLIQKLRTNLSFRHIQLISLLLFIAYGIWQTRNSEAGPTMEWMIIYHPSDFRDASVSEVITFYRDLRTGIPPLLSVVEILNVKIAQTDRVDFVGVFLYRVAIVAVFALPLLLFDKSPREFAITLILSLIFLRATVVIHPGNPQAYDVFHPLLMLVFFGCLHMLRRRHSQSAALAFLAGLMLAAAELTRPYMLLLMPLLLIGAAGLIHRLPDSRRLMVLFLCPVILLSGGWHLKLLIYNNGQIMWSNHGGFNLARAWPIPTGWTEEHEAPPIMQGREPNLNTQVHYEMSQQLQADFVRLFLKPHPFFVIAESARQIVDLLRPHTDIYQHKPRDWVLPLYRGAVWYSALMLLMNAALLLVHWLVGRQSLLSLLAEPRMLMMLFAWGAILITAVTDQGEEGRFLISFLPYFACLSWYRVSEQMRVAHLAQEAGTPILLREF